MSLWSVLIFLVLLTGCLPPSETTQLSHQPTGTVTPIPSSTPTQVWFPPTRTPSPNPTMRILPTDDYRPGLGDVLVEDPISSRKGWQIFQNTAGSAAYGTDELTIALSMPNGRLASLYSPPPPQNFYWEITASPSLCRGPDFYGLVLQATGSFDYYQFVVSCEGLLRFERIKNARLSAVLQDWTSSGQVAPGAPQVLRLGVWLNGREARFFINDVFQFSSRGMPPHTGEIGVFAQSEGKTALTVSFSDMVIRSLITGLLPGPSPQPVTPIAVNSATAGPSPASP